MTPLFCCLPHLFWGLLVGLKTCPTTDCDTPSEWNPKTKTIVVLPFPTPCSYLHSVRTGTLGQIPFVGIRCLPPSPPVKLVGLQFVYSSFMFILKTHLSTFGDMSTWLVSFQLSVFGVFGFIVNCFLSLSVTCFSGFVTLKCSSPATARVYQSPSHISSCLLFTVCVQFS